MAARDRTGTLSSNPAFQGDSILFHGSKIPTEVRKMVPHLGNLKLEKFKKLLEGIHRIWSFFNMLHLCFLKPNYFMLRFFILDCIVCVL